MLEVQKLNLLLYINYIIYLHLISRSFKSCLKERNCDIYLGKVGSFITLSLS